MENGFIVYIEDPRLAHAAVHEHQALSTLEAAKASAVLQADDCLKSLGETDEHSAEWRCL
jgi:hypothetical protein